MGERGTELSEYDRHLVWVSLDRYASDLRDACLEDQGTAEGKPGTVGNELLADLARLKRVFGQVRA